MSYKIEDVKVLSIGTTATELALCCESFLIRNLSESAVVYFREKDTDGIACTEDNGYPLAPGEGTLWPLSARCLSLISDDEDGADVRVLLIDG